VEASEQKVIFYIDRAGRNHTGEWLNKIPAKERISILDRIRRVRLGNFGDFKPIGGAKQLFELRFHQGQGFRLYYGRDGNQIVVLLNGDDKGNQYSAINKAKQLWNEYLSRKK
jgi:putative addiction module killer protein